MAILPYPSNVPKPAGAAAPKKVREARKPRLELIDRTPNPQVESLHLQEVKRQPVYQYGPASCRPEDLSWVNRTDLFPSLDNLEINST